MKLHWYEAVATFAVCLLAGIYVGVAFMMMSGS